MTGNRDPFGGSMALILDGKAVAQAVKKEIKAELDGRGEGPRPGLAVILVGEDPASQVYVGGKIRDCAEIGIRSFEHRLPADTSQGALEDLIRRLNADPQVHGLLVQLPLPKGLDPVRALNLIDPSKDVDGLHPMSLGRLMAGQPTLRACTPSGVMRILSHFGIPVAGKGAVVIGRSTIVGKPMAQMLLEQNATVTVCHSKTSDLAGVVRRADIVVAAIGRPRMITADYIREGAVVVDVGMNRLPDGKLAGDVDFVGVSPLASAITPVPGGVGLMTRAMLMHNTYQAYLEQTGRRS
jgi:methylenetetrahydrofolate dehydrogenase (NADP+)/methenyltetrahydrofolate cyclohydrolase